MIVLFSIFVCYVKFFLLTTLEELGALKNATLSIMFYCLHNKSCTEYYLEKKHNVMLPIKVILPPTSCAAPIDQTGSTLPQNLIWPEMK